MNKKTTIAIIIAAVVAIFALIGLSLALLPPSHKPQDDQTFVATYELSNIRALADNIDYNQFDLNTVINNNPAAGNLPENVKGDSSAPVLIHEYADYQCSYCALMNPYISQIVEDYKGQVAVVFRTYILTYHQNGVAAASAANAAARQGYWAAYKDLLFANQDDWFYSTGDELQGQLEAYFYAVSDGKGDLKQFRTDMASEAVAQKVAFDLGAGSEMEIGGTPWFFIDGEWIENKNMTPAEYAQKIRSAVDAKLKTSK